MTIRVDLAVRADDFLGEGPVWDDVERTLTWVDIKRRRIHEWSPATTVETVTDLPDEVSLALPCAGGGRVVTQVSSVHVHDQGLHLLCLVDESNPATRLNDGCCDDEGVLWVGTYSTRGEPEAGLYRIAPEGTVRRVVDGMIASNGISWSPDGGTLYLTDTGRSRVDAYARDDSGQQLVHLRTVIDHPGPGRPDGLAVDSDGGLWVALWGGSQIHRYAPAGQLTDIVDLPVTYPTSIAFGGADRSTAYVTTSSHHVADPGGEALAGCLLAFRAGVQGLPTRRFARR
jgi:sugar lactone lactonase YvrE